MPPKQVITVKEQKMHESVVVGEVPFRGARGALKSASIILNALHIIPVARKEELALSDKRRFV